MEKTTRKSIVKTLGFIQDVLLEKSPDFIADGKNPERILRLFEHLEAAQKTIGALTDDEYERLLQRTAKRLKLRPGFLHFLPAALVAAITATLILLISIPGFTQVNLKSTPVDDDVIKVFLNARCACSATDTATVTTFPAMYRSYFVNSVYDDGEFIPFQIYYAEKQAGQLYLVSKGACRNINTIVPLPQPGYYFVRFYHEAKPALIEIDARTSKLKIRAFGKCELHEYSSPKKN